MPVVSLPAPYGGQNNKEGSYNLAPQFATSLVNWIPGPGYMDARGPCVAISSDDCALAVNAIWQHPNGNVLLIASNGRIFLGGGTIGAAIDTTLSSGDVHGSTFQNRLILCNGVDTPRIYDGAAFANGSYSGVGLTASNLYGSTTFKGRVYYWEAAQRFFWYAAAGAFQGALAKFDLSTFARGNGYLISIAPLTFDGGAGPDDLIAFLFSNGEVMVYQGDDPASASAWQQVGAFRIGKMLGRACWAVVGSSTLVATDLGVVDLARALSVGPSDDSATAGQLFGAQNMQSQSGNITERKLAFDPANRILWLGLFDLSALGTAQNMLSLHGMDTESRSWFTTQDIAFSSGGFGNATALLATPNGTVLAAGTNGKYVSGPVRNLVGVTVQNDWFTSAGITYTAVQTFPLDSPEQNKQLAAIALQVQQVSVDNPSPACLYSVTSDAGGSSGTLNLANVLRREFNPAPAYGTRFFTTITITAKSGIRWHGTDLLVKPGRQI